MPRLFTSMLIGFVDFALLFLYDSGYGLDPLYIGSSLFLGKISIAFFQFFFGWVSDQTTTKIGRRKPYIIAFSPLMSLSFICLLLPGVFLGSTTGGVPMFIWFASFNFLFQGLYGMLTAYQSWLAELFPVQQRPKVSMIQNILNFSGTSITALFTMVVLTDLEDLLKVDPSAIPTNFLVSTITVAILVTVFLYTTAFIMPVEKMEPIQTNMKEDFLNLIRDKNFLKVTLMIGLASFAWSMIGQYMLSYTEEVLGLGGFQFYIAAGLIIVMTIVSVILWRKLITKIGKKKPLLILLGMAAFIMLFSLFGLIPLSNYFIFGSIFVAGIGLSLGAWNIYPYLIYADLAEDSQKRGKGTIKAGIYAGFPSIALNLFQAVSLFIAGVILKLPDYGFVVGSKSIGYVLWGPITSVVLIITLFYSRKYIELDFSWERSHKTE